MRASQVALVVKNLPANAGDIRDVGSVPGFRKIPWRRAWQPTPLFLPGESHGQRSLVVCSLWNCKELDTTEQLIYTSCMVIPHCCFNLHFSNDIMLNIF